MHAIDTVVIGAGHAGLAVSSLLSRGRPRPRGARPRARRREVALRALGLPAPAHAELDDPAARPRVRGPRPGRLHVRPAVRPPPRGLRRVLQGAGADRHHRARGDRRRRRLPRRHRPRDLASPPRRRRHRAVGSAATSRVPWSGLGPDVHSDGLRATATRRSCRPGECSWSGPPPPACRSPTSSPAPAARSCWPSGGTPGCPAATAAWTSSGGWSAPAGWPARSTSVADAEAARREPSLQLVGRGEAARLAANLDLGTLQGLGRPAHRPPRGRSTVGTVQLRRTTSRTASRTPSAGCTGSSTPWTGTSTSAG